MNLSVCPQALYSMDFEAALDTIAELGLGALELPVDARSPWIDLDELRTTGAAALRRALEARGLRLSAISNHQEGQLLLGPHHRDTDEIFAGSATEKSAFAEMRLRKTAELANELEVGLVIGFVGAEDYTRFFPWPNEKGWQLELDAFRDRMGSLLDRMDELGVDFGHEPHPKQVVYNVETALESVAVLDGHPRWGFNLDPANLMLAGVDPVVFVAELGERILHVHAKDGEVVPHHARRSGLLAHGAWDRKDRGFRFRVPGWGDVPWKRLITELRLADYEGYLAIENEDPVFHPVDGLKKALHELRPLLPDGPRQERWW